MDFWLGLLFRVGLTDVFFQNEGVWIYTGLMVLVGLLIVKLNYKVGRFLSGMLLIFSAFYQIDSIGVGVFNMWSGVFLAVAGTVLIGWGLVER